MAAPLQVPALWLSLCQYLGIPAPLGRRFYAIVRTPALEYNLCYAPRLRSDWSYYHFARHLLSDHLAPTYVVMRLEDTVARGELTRDEASLLEEKLFARCDKAGVWR